MQQRAQARATRGGDADEARREQPRQAAAAARLALAVGLLVAVAGAALLLSHSAPRRTGSNGVLQQGPIARVPPGGRFCQRRELLPTGTASLRVGVATITQPGPGLRMTLSRHGRVLRAAQVAPGWIGSSVSVPIAPTSREYDDVDACFAVIGPESADVIGGTPPPGQGSAAFDGRPVEPAIRIDYYRAGPQPWWSYAATVVPRIGRGHGRWGGVWIPWAIAVLSLVSWALAIRLALRTIVADPPERAPDAPGRRSLPATLRRVPATAWTLALIACLNAAAWSLITPPFTAADEMTHVAYVQQLGESGRPPVVTPQARFSPELSATLAAVRAGTPDVAVYRAKTWTPQEERRLERSLARPLSRRGNGDAGAVDPEPPLFYALEAIPYRVGLHGTLLARLELMRLLSAALAGVTALFAFLFVREALPRRPWAWSVGGLGAAFVPVFGHISGAVNPDALLLAVSAALLYCLARAFRRGMTPALAVWIGVVFALGLLTKINDVGLAPGAAIAIVLAARRTTGAWNVRTARLAGVALAVGIAPYLLLGALEALVWDRSLVLAHSAAASHADRGGLGGQLGYLWQVYLPRLPGMTPATSGYAGYSLWFKTFVGAFGGVSVEFPSWAYRIALVVLALVAGLAVRELARAATTLRRRRAELLGYMLMTVSLLLLIGVAAVRGWTPGLAAAAQGRYLLPLLALFAALLTLAARGAGERWGRTVGVLVVVTAMAWGLLSQLAAIGGFYG